MPPEHPHANLPFLFSFIQYDKIQTLQISSGVWGTAVNNGPCIYRSRTRLGAFLTHTYYVARIFFSRKGGAA